MKQFVVPMLGVLLTACLTGCPAATPAPPGGPVSFASQIQPIFNQKCADCHRAGGSAERQGISMLLTAGDTPISLLNQASAQNSNWTLVVPGDAANSLLYVKVLNSFPPVGGRMPPSVSSLSSTELGLIRDWINQGALNN